MDFGLSAEQVLLQDTIDKALSDEVPLELLRRLGEQADGSVAQAWACAKEIGIPGLIIEERFGGAGLGLMEAALVSQILGTHVAPIPWIASGVVAPVCLKKAGSEELQEEWLPKLANGEKRLGLAFSEHAGAREEASVSCSDGKLNGRSLFVIDFKADAYLVATRDSSVYLVQSNSPGLTEVDLVTVDKTRAVGELVFDSVEADIVLEKDKEFVSELLDIGRVMIAADTLGAAQYMLAAAVAYSKEREQFGRVIGSFQAVKHLCADMAAQLEPCLAMVWYAGHALEYLPEESRVYACQTKAHLSEVGKMVAKSATEVHGGTGFTDLLGIHYWFKRIGLNRQLMGGPERLREEAAIAQGFV